MVREDPARVLLITAANTLRSSCGGMEMLMRRPALVLATAIVAVLLFTSNAVAARATSQISPVAGAGYTYYDSATISNAPIYASTFIYTRNGGNVPPGYMGVAAFLYKGSALCTSTSYSYNSGTSSGISKPTPPGTNCGSGAYRSQGAVKVWQGTQYFTYGTFSSPNLNY